MKKKKRRKEEREKRESGCLIFEHEIEAVRGVSFGKKIVDQIPLSRFSSEFWAFWYIVGLKQTTVAKVMSIWSLLVISVILSVILSIILFVIISVIQIKSNLLSKSDLLSKSNQIKICYPNQIKSSLLSKSNPICYPNQV